MQVAVAPVKQPEIGSSTN